VDGNVMIKMLVKDTPTLMGNKLKQNYFKVPSLSLSHSLSLSVCLSLSHSLSLFASVSLSPPSLSLSLSLSLSPLSVSLLLCLFLSSLSFSVSLSLSLSPSLFVSLPCFQRLYLYLSRSLFLYESSMIGINFFLFVHLLFVLPPLYLKPLSVFIFSVFP
jgi:hypothetical protein